jgi:hypothetical protein
MFRKLLIGCAGLPGALSVQARASSDDTSEVLYVGSLMTQTERSVGPAFERAIAVPQ